MWEVGKSWREGKAHSDPNEEWEWVLRNLEEDYDDDDELWSLQLNPQD